MVVLPPGLAGTDQHRLPHAAAETSRVLAARLALIRADIEEIHHTLHGDGKGRKGLVERVEELATVADGRCFSFRAVLWLGGGIVAAATAIMQFKQAVVELFRQ